MKIEEFVRPKAGSSNLRAWHVSWIFPIPVKAKPTHEELIDRDVRASDRSYRRRKFFDRWFSYVRSCAVCTSALPPIDFLCPVCWSELGRVMNRGAKLRQLDFVFPTYSLLTWTPQTTHFVKPFIYGFKGGYAVQAADRLAELFLSERSFSSRIGTIDISNDNSHVPQTPNPLVISAPAEKFDHSQLWSRALAAQLKTQSWSPLTDKDSSKESQKERTQSERGQRRHLVKEHFAKPAEEAKGAKRILFADDVITTGSTAMAAYMALGDPEQFEVWTLVARPRLAVK